MFIFLINLIATKQSHIHDAITRRLLRQQDHLLKIKFSHVPRNDAAVVGFALVVIANEAGLMFILQWLLRGASIIFLFCLMPIAERASGQGVGNSEAR